MRNLLAGLLFAALLLPAPLWAQTSTEPKRSKKIRVGKTVYDFEEVDILGQLKRPTVGQIQELPEVRFRQLLDLDESFLPEIIRAIHEF